MDKMKEIYIINCKVEQDYYKELEIYYKSKGFNSLEEYQSYWEKILDDEFKKDMERLKRINKVYSKGGYLTIR